MRVFRASLASIALIFVAALAAVPAAAQTKVRCPDVIASLLPKTGSLRGGDYNASGPIGMGNGFADLRGGEIVYVAYETECQPETIDTGKKTQYPPTPNVKLKGVALTANARLEIDLEGTISFDLAKAAVSEVFENLKKADFEKAR